jgi:hypothetical protein
MRMIMLFLVGLFLLSGCLLQKDADAFNVSLLNASHEDVFSQEQNKTLDRVSFIIKNNEDFDVYCDVFLNLNNLTNSSSSRGVVGVLPPGKQKSVSMSVDMLKGESELNITRQCKKSFK